MSFDSTEIAWKDLEVFIEGKRITKIRSLKYKAATDKEHLYAAGTKPIAIQSGNETYTGEMKLLKGQLDALNRAAVAAGYQDIRGVTMTITAVYKPTSSDPMQTDTLSGVQIEAYEKSLEQNAKFMEIALPFKFMDIASA